MPEEVKAAIDESLAKLKKEYPGFTTIGTTAHKEHPVWSEDFTTPILLMILVLVYSLGASIYTLTTLS